MSSVSGACLVSKISGMVYIREDLTPLTLEWKAIDQLKTVSIQLNTLVNLKATKEGAPKMMLKVIYNSDGEEKHLNLAFNNRPTMNNIKESLLTIVARLKTVIKDSPAPSTPGTPSASSTPAPGAPSGNELSFSNPNSLSDASLLKNLVLQQKLLMEDKNLRNIFTQSVINYKLSPSVFWSTRLSQLRTFALTISQHKGPYNVLSTIKPVASSDNQVNVNVTRDTINEIFDTYPIIKKAFNDLVPEKFQEGEFWSRFFNSKLFRRLRGDKINNSSDRGDVILDKYLYVDQEFLERGETEIDPTQNEPPRVVNKFIDIEGNEQDNSQKLGNMPDLTMRFNSDAINKLNPAIGIATRGTKQTNTGQENEMIILMKNMNKLSSKMVHMSKEDALGFSHPGNLQEELKEYEEELDLHDLNDVRDLKFIKLDINTVIEHGKNEVFEASNVDDSELTNFLKGSVFSSNNVRLDDTHEAKKLEIEKTSNDILMLVRHNFRQFRMSNLKSSSNNQNLIPEETIQEIITFNITIVELLSHFWKLYLNGNNPGQLRKIFASLKNCKNGLSALKEKIIQIFNNSPIIAENNKLKDKLIKELHTCFNPMEIGVNTACENYIKAVKLAQGDGKSETNENGKRALEQ